mmetsp:Transcript_2289/g.7583  ORF Transcript_2289/g.7583 Transcript_2289/m.7583 type:complete len:210 (-) Transcript_2289:1670-2299(-)
MRFGAARCSCTCKTAYEFASVMSVLSSATAFVSFLHSSPLRFWRPAVSKLHFCSNFAARFASFSISLRTFSKAAFAASSCWSLVASLAFTLAFKLGTKIIFVRSISNAWEYISAKSSRVSFCSRNISSASASMSPRAATMADSSKSSIAGVDFGFLPYLEMSCASKVRASSLTSTEISSAVRASTAPFGSSGRGKSRCTACERLRICVA